MYDLLALAFEGDSVARSATYMLGKDLSGMSFPESFDNGAWHGSSHHGDKPDNVANYAKMNRYHVQNLGLLCRQARRIRDQRRRHGARSHPHLQGQQYGELAPARARRNPVVLSWAASTGSSGNRHIVFPDNTERTSNMLLAVLDNKGHVYVYVLYLVQVGLADLHRLLPETHMMCKTKP